MTTRRKFIQQSALASVAALATASSISGQTSVPRSSNAQENQQGSEPVIISTWNHGIAANFAALKVIVNKGRALDAVEQGVRVTESDPKVTSVGYGGRPDRDGFVTLDACIMDEFGNAGSVAALEHIMNPISVARMVMEKTPHVMLVGEGALNFALANGFKKQNILTNEAKAEWEEWKSKTQYKPMKYDQNNHDTIGMLAIDSSGNLSGACTTSGAAWKYHGRVGDSPIIGAGLFLDNEVGGACATGKGEAVIRIAGSAVIVEMMRQGMTPQAACEAAVKRIIHLQKDYADFQVGFIAINKKGEVGAYALQAGFQYAHCRNNKNELINSESFLK